MLETLVDFAAVGFVIWLVLYAVGRLVGGYMRYAVKARYKICVKRVSQLLAEMPDHDYESVAGWSAEEIKTRLIRASTKNGYRPARWYELPAHVWLQLLVYSHAAKALTAKVPLTSQEIHLLAARLDMAILISKITTKA